MSVTPHAAPEAGADRAGRGATVEYTNANIWDEWVPEDALRAVLAGEDVVADIGQVKGVWKQLLEREVRSGRLVKWKGHWFPQAGAPFGMGPLKTCYGAPGVAAYFAEMNRGIAARAAITKATGG